MIKHFILLEWKQFIRSASFATNLFLKIVMALVALYFIAIFTVLGAGLYYILKKNDLDPLATVNRFIIYYFFVDLAFRYMMQKMPVMNIVPLMALPIKRKTIVHFALGKTAVSYFNWSHAFFFIPFTVVLLLEGHQPVNVILWHLSVIAIIYSNNFINLLINNKDSIFYPLLVVIAGVAVAQYYEYFDLTLYTSVFFTGLYDTGYLFLLPMLLLAGTYYFSFNFFNSHLRLDAGLAKKTELAKSEDFNWLNRYGTLGTFLKNDLRLLKRNKRSKKTILTSVVFLFYGLLFFTGAVEAYDNDFMKIFAGIFITGGFMFIFGQFVPSWDSSYYQLMMSQNIKYREYLDSKWWLIVIATAISTVLATFYLYFGLHTYLIILAAAIYNIGVNSHLVLLAGAFIKTPIDLNSGKNVLGNKQAFNIKAILLTLPKLVLPILLYVSGSLISGSNLGLLFVALAGICGLAFKNFVFSKIEKIYKAEKYATIAAYKRVE